MSLHCTDDPATRRSADVSGQLAGVHCAQVTREAIALEVRPIVTGGTGQSWIG